jgi:hypothetical protein
MVCVGEECPEVFQRSPYRTDHFSDISSTLTNVLRILAQVPVPPTGPSQIVLKQDSVSEYYTMPSEVVSPRHDLEDNSNPAVRKWTVLNPQNPRQATYWEGFIKLWISSSVF